MNDPRTRAWLGAGIALLSATAALAAPPPPAGLSASGRAQVIQRVNDCRKVADSVQRLACFDEAAAGLEQAEARGDIVVVDREQARKVRRQAFGFTLPSLAMFEKGEKQEEIDNTTGKVAAARQNGAGRWVVKLEDGATWMQVDANELFADPKAGDPVKIRKASLGSYLMTVGRSGAFRARREE